MQQTKVSLLIFIFFISLFLISTVSAHSGRTNSKGCHNKKSDNTYHCHKKNKKSKETKITSTKIRVIDGDTIHLGNKKIRFSGIDAPEKNQTCSLNGETIFCGIIAKKKLEQKISKNIVKCVKEGLDRYNRIIAECFVNDQSLSSFLVRSGYAFAYKKYSNKFVEDENYAKTNKLGLWNTIFEYPWKFREKR
ncbi:thermonuclease family protein [Candidatus Pelagibacter sp. HIMB1611]|uniref:thermonuclease family protein n=1 Tax=Candidatus Pelagibacter sp. HIMB1611 TaxID=3413357 RepID=UPI003F87EDB6